jgi:hypothetical protein
MPALSQPVIALFVSISTVFRRTTATDGDTLPAWHKNSRSWWQSRFPEGAVPPTKKQVSDEIIIRKPNKQLTKGNLFHATDLPIKRWWVNHERRREASLSE